MLIVHLFVSYAHVDLFHLSLPPGVGGWLRLLLVALLDCSVYLSVYMYINVCNVICTPNETSVN